MPATARVVAPWKGSGPGDRRTNDHIQRPAWNARWSLATVPHVPPVPDDQGAEETEDDDVVIERRVVVQLDWLGVPYDLVQCDPALADTAAFCAAYGYD